MAPVMQPWCIGDMLDQMRALVQHADDLTPLRHARHRLSLYWLASPSDHLQALYQGEFGALQRLCIEQLGQQSSLLSDEQIWRDQLQTLLQASVGSSAFLNYWLALMPYLRPGELRLDDPSAVIPSWLLEDYQRVCEPDRWAAQLFPLSSRRDQAAREWLCEEAVLARALVLLNGFQLDPSADAQLQELAELRRVVAQLWLDLEPNQLKANFESPIGLLTRSLVVSGFHRRAVLPQDSACADVLRQQLDEASDERVVQQLFAALLFSATLDLTRVEALLPAWCQEELRSLLV